MALLLNQSCLGGGSDYYRDRVAPFLNDLKPNYKPQIVDGVMEPVEFPDLDEDQKTLVGIDSNHDGVRDDMEIFINRNFKYDYERETYKQFFKRAPHFFENYKNFTKQERMAEDNGFFRDKECLRYIHGKLKLPDSPLKFNAFESLFNTPSRVAADNYKYQELAGESYGSGISTEEQAYFTCPEKIKNKYPLQK